MEGFSGNGETLPFSFSDVARNSGTYIFTLQDWAK